MLKLKYGPIFFEEPLTYRNQSKFTVSRYLHVRLLQTAHMSESEVNMPIQPSHWDTCSDAKIFTYKHENICQGLCLWALAESSRLQKKGVGRFSGKGKKEAAYGKWRQIPLAWLFGGRRVIHQM